MGVIQFAASACCSGSDGTSFVTGRRSTATPAVALDPPKDRPDHAAPVRLLELIELLGKRYGAATERTDVARDAAIERGETAMDLISTVPRSAGPVIRQLRALMREANDFCEREQLLTLASSPLQRRFGDWFYRQFLDQIDGRGAQPWDGPMVDREG
jgi:hypothetical protein